jgi:hypothetical protein
VSDYLKNKFSKAKREDAKAESSREEKNKFSQAEKNSEKVGEITQSYLDLTKRKTRVTSPQGEAQTT